MLEMKDSPKLTIGWFGTSIMEHFEAYNQQMCDQSNLPEVGSQVIVESWRHKGYVQRLSLDLQVTWPQVDFTVDNQGLSGATSRDILAKVRRIATETRYDLVFLSCGINDVWRGFQGRQEEAVAEDEFARNYTELIQQLKSCARVVVCLAETPFGVIDEPIEVADMNRDLSAYNKIAAEITDKANVPFLDVSVAFTAVANEWARAELRQSSKKDIKSLWSDGAHLSELGDALMSRQVGDFLQQQQIVPLLLLKEPL